MSTRKEKLSAFLDNDMHRDELMSFSLSGEDEDARIAQRYQMIGEGLRGELSEASFVDVSAAVREAIAGESLAVAGKVDAGRAAASKGAGQRAREDRADSLFDLSRWLRPLAGMAVAASVAVVMVVTLSTPGGGALNAPLAQKPADNMATTAVATGTIPPAAVRAVSNRQQLPNPYINQHLEYVNQDSLQGRLPYVRAVSYESRPPARH